MRHLYYILAILLAFSLAACGSKDSDNGSSGGYSGKTSAAKVDDSNSEDIGAGVHIAAKKSVESEINGSNIAFSSGGQSPLPAILQPLHTNVESILNVRSATRNTSGSMDWSDFCDSGSASYTYNYSDDYKTGTMSFTYNNCTYSYSYAGNNSSITYNGSYFYEFRPGYWYWDYDLTVTSSFNGETDQYSMRGTFECTGDDDSLWSYTDCTYSETYSEGGVTYRVSNLTFTSTGNSYSFTARVYHSEYGYVEVVATNLVYCVGGGFESGTITISDSDSAEVLSITYSGCDDPAVIAYQGTTYLVDQ
ncbi:MAG: hypothetical protein LAT65_17195 [Saccharospirillum sp.]|nr:hypothetical protein [Saccharospirillum sp.]